MTTMPCQKLLLIFTLTISSVFAIAQSNPGGVASASVWLKGDAGVNVTGANVTGWINQANGSNNFTGTGSPQLATGNINFNPAILFGGSNYLTSSLTVLPANSNYTKFVVFRYDGVSANNIISSGGVGDNALWGGSTNTSLSIFHAGNIVTASNVANGSNYYLGTAGFASGAAQGTFININGENKASATSNAPYGASIMQVGAHGNGNNLTGRIAEVVVYPSALGTASVQTKQVESYLAVKYGLTLAHDYLASDGTTTTYSVLSYSNNIAGIGRDDNSALNQRQSRSINAGNQVLMAMGSIAPTNAENTASAATDYQFLVWGDDNMPGHKSNTGAGQVRLASTWKLQNTNSFNQAVTVYYPRSGVSDLSTSPVLLYGSQASLNDGSATQVSPGPDVIVNGETYLSYAVTFPSTATLYFSFGRMIVPEICGNGIDDDLNGYTDGLDAACTAIPTCVAPAAGISGFGIKQEWVSSTVNALATSASPTVADLNGDGLPEILTVRAGGAGLTYFKGDGSDLTKNTIDYNIQLRQIVSQATMQPAVADIDRDGVPEVIVVGNDWYLYVFNNVSGSTTQYKYRSSDLISSRFVAGSPRVSDIDEDGTPEIIVGLDVFQFNFANHSLVKAITGSATAPFGRDGTDWGADVVVVDIMSSNPGKELVAGSQVYGVNLISGVTTVLANLSTIVGTGIIPANNDGPTAVADLDNDGQLDIAYPNGTHLVVWDPSAAVLKMSIAYPNNGYTYMGMPAIANIYNEQVLDSKPSDLPEIIFNARFVMYAFNLNNTVAPVWSLVTSDGSAETGVTAFDLNGDGVKEIVYNDENNIRIINGNTHTPANIANFASGTATWMEHPVVADVDNDGGTEFVCISNGAVAFTGMLRVFGPADGTTAWQGSRKIWNARGYRPTSINDDLSIPLKEQNIKLEYPVGSGRYPLDVFNSQIDARLTAPGIAAAPELSISNMKITASDISCSFVPASAELIYTISNNGDALAPAGTPVRFYVGDPMINGVLIPGASDLLAVSLAAGASVTRTVVLNLSAYTAPYTIYAVVNDNGTDPVPVAFPVVATNVNECNYTNNIGSLLISPVSADFGNLGASWPQAYTTTVVSDAAWLGISLPSVECATSETDGADGLVLTAGSVSGNGSSSSPWVMAGVGEVFNFTLTINGNGAAKPVYWGLWYDADGNGSFTDPTDVFLNGDLVHHSPASTSFSFAVPSAAGASAGAIRVIATATDPSFTKAMNGAGAFTNGEVEDYFVVYAMLLPVTLEKFTASTDGKCAATIEWITASKQNSDWYEVLHSSNGSAFATIAIVKSNNFPTGSTYRYLHNNPTDGTNYYRLKISDKDGAFQYSKTVTVVTTCGTTGIRLSPNPVTSMATITGLKAGDKVIVLGSDGRREIQRLAVSGSDHISLSGLPAGIHLVQVIRNGVMINNIKVSKL